MLCFNIKFVYFPEFVLTLSVFHDFNQKQIMSKNFLVCENQVELYIYQNKKITFLLLLNSMFLVIIQWKKHWTYECMFIEKLMFLTKQFCTFFLFFQTIFFIWKYVFLYDNGFGTLSQYGQIFLLLLFQKKQKKKDFKFGQNSKFAKKDKKKFFFS